MKDAIVALLVSASKIVFLMIAATVCVGFFMKLLDPKDFMVLAGMVFVYYFNKPAGTQPAPTSDDPSYLRVALPAAVSVTKTETTTTAPPTVPGVK